MKHNFLAAFSILAMCIGCAQPEEGWNRGIGVYPGNPDEDFSPKMTVDNQYRNIALHRAAWNSSSYDYYLTATLLTDGIVETQLPKYSNVETNSGAPRRRESEWMVDGHKYTRVHLNGGEAYYQINLHNGWTAKFNRLQYDGYVLYLEDKADGSHDVSFSYSNDGKEWIPFHTIKGRKLIGEESKPRKHSDADKADALGEQLLPTRKFLVDVTLPEDIECSMIRIDAKMKGAEEWIAGDMKLFLGDKEVDLVSSANFSSTWMSLGNEEEWVYVDLGRPAKFDKVVLDWLSRPAAGKIQVSNDAKSWKDLADLPAEGNRDEISLNGKGRYVRVLMRGSADGKPFMLTEMEVWGKGGLVARPKAAPAPTATEITLSGGNWKLLRASETEAEGAEIAAEGFAADNWLVATVPGTVLTSYVNLGAVPEPDFAGNIMHISDSYFNSDFWYRNEFEVPADFLKDKTWLEFDGINWKADIFLNGKQIGRIDGAFMRGRFDISEVAVPGKNYLAVRIIKNDHPGAVKEKDEQHTGRNGGVLGFDNPTFHASIGWDWITTTRGRNIGIWNDVRVVREGAVSIDAPYVNVALPLPDTTYAVLTPEALVKNNSDEPVRGTLKGKIGNIEFEQDLNLEAGQETLVRFDTESFPQLVMQNPKLWWPNGYGEQNLYDAGFTFVIKDEVSDKVDFKVGVRQVNAKEIDSVLHLYVNGRRYVGRGGNWGFSESNLNYRGREYDIAVAYHANENFNIMRNWVGQTGDMELYEACDRYGIMVWQDFWLANPADGPDPLDNKMFLDNAEDYVKRIRRYPSMLIYCGRNEGYPPAEIEAGLRKIVKEWHSDLYYIPSSADDCVSGHGPYRALTPRVYFARKKGSDMFHSERGMPSVLTYESMQRTFSEDGMWPQGKEWYYHDYTLRGAQACESFNNIIAEGYGECSSAEEFAEYAQFVNYDGYRAMFESRSIKRKGLLLWMSHPCWPSMTWQTYDWYFETNGSYFGSKKGSEPLHVQWNSHTDTIEVVNYSAGAQKDLLAKAMVVNLDGSIVWEKEMPLDCNEDSTNRLFKVEFPENSSEVHFIKLLLTKDGKVLSDNFYVNGKEYGNHQALRYIAKANVKTSTSFAKGKDGVWRGKVELENKSSVPAVMVRLNVLGRKDGLQILPMFYSDNFFSLMPGEKKTVTLKWYNADTRGNRPKVEVTGYNL